MIRYFLLWFPFVPFFYSFFGFYSIGCKDDRVEIDSGTRISNKEEKRCLQNTTSLKEYLWFTFPWLIMVSFTGDLQSPCNFVLLVLTTSIISPIFIFWVLFVHLIETYYAGLSSLLLIKRSSFVMIHLLIEQLFSPLWICYSCSNKWAYTNLARFVMYGSCIN